MKAIERFWYNKTSMLRFLFYPLHWLLLLLVNGRAKRLKTQAKVLDAQPELANRPPVVIIGNINVGGTGKTPVLISLVQTLTTQGLAVGVLSRGYGGEASYPLQVSHETTADLVGDEPKLIYEHTQVPVMVDPDRVRGLKALMQAHKLDLILTDDGLQHYKLPRDLEVVVVDAERGFGNQLVMPFGPLREAVERVASADALVVTGTSNTESFNHKQLFKSQTHCYRVRHQVTHEVWAFEDFCNKFKDQAFVAVAGIGHPDKFFNQLEVVGLNFEKQAFNDHHRYQAFELSALCEDNQLIIMTEKDAVKCTEFAMEQIYVAEVSTVITPSLSDFICQQLEIKTS